MHPLKILFFLLCCLCSFSCFLKNQQENTAKGHIIALELDKVIDGDSLLLKNGEQIRLCGINAPEWNQPMGEDAKKYLITHLQKNKPRNLSFQPCSLEKHDKYGRILAWVEVNGKDIGGELLENGFALPMMIPPCGLIKLEVYQEQAFLARKQKKGIWQDILTETLTHQEAKNHIHSFKAVYGEVYSIYEGKNAIHLNFERNWKKDFTITIFKKDLWRFKNKGIDPKKFYQAKKVKVFGYIQSYYGPQIIARSPLQIEIY